MSDIKWLQGYMIDKDKIRSELANPYDEDIFIGNWMDIVRQVKLDYLALTGFQNDEAVTIIVLNQEYDKEELESTFPKEMPSDLHRFRIYLIPGVFRRIL